MPPVKRVLIIDDETSIRESLDMYLSEKGLEVEAAGTGAEGLAAYHKYHPRVIILDIRLPDISGLDILKRIMEADHDAKVIMITAYHDMETTIEAMRQGAYDYIHKPIDVDELDHAVTKSLHIADKVHAIPHLLQDDQESGVRHQIVGKTPAMRALFKTIGLVSRNRATILVEGETGTGKELIAQVIHESSLFNDQPYVTVDCTTLVDNLFESELFGYERGAFTGASETKKGRLELAGEGTILFDEVGDLPLAMQAKLLRFLEYREFIRVGGTKTILSPARIIAATNRNLGDLAARGQFRQDLLFRLRVITISVPPLRERLDDLPELVRFFLHKINRDLGATVTQVEDRAYAVLRDYSWPGNVRELKNVLIKSVLESRGSVLLADALKTVLAASSGDLPPVTGSASLDDLEKSHILKTMAETKGNLSAAARLLRISRPTLRKRLKLYGLNQPDPRNP
ncbi:MAG: sigma-54-dependent Fis family transcriptional regulator [Deltaproteobacteria bacterium]|nr:sigma-54-dependent Fis family transcriptional regulator [Deltaproteobacteria bacterium]